MANTRLDLAYDGTRFHGYARQPEVRTVQGELETALRDLVGEVETFVAGRTDKGVHASGQVVSFHTEEAPDHLRMVRSLNRRLGPEIAVLDAVEVPEGFHARFSATSRAYRYRVLNREAPDPFLAATSWHVPTPLDAAEMHAAMAPLIGEHDFASFCRRAEGRPTTRDVKAASWERRGGLVELEITASSFCHQMVRSVVALAVDVGRGRVDPAAVAGILAARDRQAGRGAAPAHGLTLVAVGYD